MNPKNHHHFVVSSYLKPTSCSYCNELLWGVVRQGLYCEICHESFHKKCAYHIRNNCSIQSNLPPSPIPHRLVKKTFTTSSVCLACQHVIVDNVKAYHCEDCGFDLHKECKYNCVNDCGDQVPVDQFNASVNLNSDEQISNLSSSPMDETDEANSVGLYRLFHPHQKMSIDEFGVGEEAEMKNKNACESEKNLSPSKFLSVSKDSLRADSFTSTSSRSSQYFDIQGHILVCTSSSKPTICKHCQHFIWVPSRNAYKCEKCVMKCHRKCANFLPKCIFFQDQTLCFAGWVLYKKTSKGSDGKLIKRRFAKLDGLKIGFYLSEEDSKPKEVIMIGKILETILTPAEDSHQGADDSGASHSSFTVILARSKIEIQVDSYQSAQAWLDAIQKAQNQSCIQSDSFCGEKSQSRNFSAIYECEKSGMLGSGQFGVVVNAREKSSGKIVAVKIVDKKRFQGRKDEFQTELDLHRTLNHPGIIRLFGIYSSEVKLFIVMEKALGGDMLDFILKQSSGCLDERRSKFLSFQILVAIKYLHDQFITHRDLKPENVLLMSKSDFPQAKLCDFGFAKIIGESSFMMSIVGTPAYVAPEVVHPYRLSPDRPPGYSSSVDMWSIGVVLYVSISGNFPFLEDEDVFEQVRHANFFYPKSHWAAISQPCKDLIRKLLCVNPENRYSLEMVFHHPWFQDELLLKDLQMLENSVGENYLSHFLNF